MAEQPAYYDEEARARIGTAVRVVEGRGEPRGDEQRQSERDRRLLVARLVHHILGLQPTAPTRR